MSKQWGHGYCAGVRDAENGNVKVFATDIRRIAEFFVCHLCLSNMKKYYDRSLARTTDVRLMFLIAGYDGAESEKWAKRVYDYILDNEPLNCYVTGRPGSPWHEDYYVLPIHTLSEEDCLSHIRDLENLGGII